MGYRRALHVLDGRAEPERIRDVALVVREAVAGREDARGELPRRAAVEERGRPLVVRAEASAVYERQVEVVFHGLRYLARVANLHLRIEPARDPAVEDLLRPRVYRLLRGRGRVHLADAGDVEPVAVPQERTHLLRLVLHRYYESAHVRNLP